MFKVEFESQGYAMNSIHVCAPNVMALKEIY